MHSQVPVNFTFVNIFRGVISVKEAACQPDLVC